VVLYFFVFWPSGTAVLLIVLFLSLLTLVPLKWVHPIRVQALRPVSLSVSFIFLAAACYEIGTQLSGTYFVKVIFVMTALYFLIFTLIASWKQNT